MIHGTGWDQERVERVVVLHVPDGYRLLTQLEWVEPGDLALGYDGVLSLPHPTNYGEQARCLVPFVRRGVGLDHTFEIPPRPEEYAFSSISINPVSGRIEAEE